MKQHLSFAILAALIHFSAFTSAAKVMVEKNFTAQEIIDNWQIIDYNTGIPMAWNGIVDGRASVNVCGDFPDYIELRSLKQYYDVMSVELTYTTGARTHYICNPYVEGDETIIFEEAGAEGKVSDLYVKPQGTTPTGYVIYEANFKNTKATSFNISGIKITYDGEGGKRGLKWSASTATAVIGSTFTAPTLSGANLSGVVYSSSDLKVACIDAQGQISIGMAGVTTITASAPVEGVWNADAASYTLTVARPAGFYTETVNVATPGTLKELIVDLDGRPGELIITGSLNSADLNYIAQASGKMSTVQTLDLSAISLAFDDGLYQTKSGSDGTGIGLGTITTNYYLSATNRVEFTSKPNGLGGGSAIEDVYSNNLAGLFISTPYSEIKLPKGIIGIGKNIFVSSALNSVTFPDVITEIPDNAFASTLNIRQVELPSTVNKIGKAAFKGSGILNVMLNSIIDLEEEAFYQSKLETLDFMRLREIGGSALRETALGGEVRLLNATKLGAGCMKNNNITSLSLGSAVDSIPASAFAGNKLLKTINLPQGLKYIGNSAFIDDEIAVFDIPAAVEYIGSAALPYSMLYKHLPENGVWYFGKVAYKYDPRIEGVSDLSLKSGIVSISDGFVSETLKSTLTTLTVPDGCKTIGECNRNENATTGWIKTCFAECENLQTVNWPNSLEVIGDGAFFGCKKLKIDTWPSSLKAIGQSTFHSCESIYDVTFGENLEFLGQQSFQNCNSISSVKLYSTRLVTSGTPFWNGSIEKATIGRNVTNIPNQMFVQCSDLIKVVFEDPEATTPELNIDDRAFYGCTSLKIESLPKRTVKVGESAFESVTFGSDFTTGNIRSIGERAFLGARGIEHLELTNCLEECGVGAFSDIESLKSIVYNVPSLNVKEGYYYNSPFARSSNFRSGNLAEVRIGGDVESIPAYLFNYQPSVSSLTFDRRDAGGKSLYIGTRAFRECGITAVELPDVPTDIADYAFAGCVGMSSLRLGDGTKTIADHAFWQCHALKSVDIPTSVVSIGDEAFYQYTSNGYYYVPQMEYIYFHTVRPVAMGGSVVHKQTVVYVPVNGKSDYERTSLGANRIETYAITSFSISRSEASIETGKSVWLTTSFQPSEYNGLDIKWTTSDANVAIVDNHGNVTGVNGGKATITASSAYMSGYAATCTVSVNGDSGVEEIDSDLDPSLPIEVYNISGLKVATGLEGLSPGIYIVRQGNTTRKIIIR